MSVNIDQLINRLLQDDIYFGNTYDDIEYYNKRILELNKQIKHYKKYSQNAIESDKKIIRQEVLELSMRIDEYIKLRDSAMLSQRVKSVSNQIQSQRIRCDSDLIFQFDF